MATRKEHSSGYRSIEARAVRGIDAAGAGLKSVWDHMSLKRGSVAGIATAAVLGAGTLGVGTTSYFMQDGPIGGTEYTVDNDISGDAYMSRAYSYVKYDDVHYILIHDESRYELYQFNDNLNQFTLMGYEAASSIISDIVVSEQESIDTWSGQGRFTVYRAACDIIYEPTFTQYDQIQRKTSGCEWRSNQTPQEVIDIFEDTYSFWQDVEANITQANYGPDASNIGNYVAPDTSHIESYGENLTDTAQYAFGGWLALGILGAGVSGLRRRAEKKMNGPL